MKELTAADESFPKQITSALSGLSAGLMMGNADSTADRIKTKLLPLVDSYVATIDEAVAAADAYMANKDDTETKQAVEKIRKRGESFRKARERFVALEQKIRGGGVSLDEISSSLMNIGMMMSVGL
jgi:hypothetical protein